MIFLLLVFFHSGVSLAVESTPLFPESLTCLSEGKIRYLEMGKSKTEIGKFCFSEDRSYFFSSSCRDEKCAALKADLSEIKSLALAGQVGSPGFKLCRRAGGVAELLDFFDGKRWWSMDRCRFEADGSFVDTGILLRLWGRTKKP